MKIIAIAFFLLVLGCSSNENIQIGPLTDSSTKITNPYTPLLGKWSKALKTGERIIEIKDSTNVLVYNISTNQEISDTLLGTLSMMPNSYISIHFPTWRFYYRWEVDTLIQKDEQGEQERYVKKSF